MRRREFIALLAAASVQPPVSVGAQQSTKVYRIAFLHPSHPVAEMTENSSLRYYRIFFEELRRLGYVEGQNVLIERFSGEGHVENYASLVEKIVNRKFDVVFAHTAWLVTPLKKATSTIPIVAVSSDPINDGLITSLAHPGGNLTNGCQRRSGLGNLGKAFSVVSRGRPNIIEDRNSGAPTQPRT